MQRLLCSLLKTSRRSFYCLSIHRCLAPSGNFIFYFERIIGSGDSVLVSTVAVIVATITSGSCNKDGDGMMTLGAAVMIMTIMTVTLAVV